MSRLIRTAALLLCAALLLAFLFPEGRALSAEMQRVLVTNFPDLQKISGTVSVEGPIRHAMQQRFAEVVVSPVKPTETQRLAPGGTLITDGFTSVVLGLSGQFKTATSRPGTIGAILIPDEEPILRAFEEEGKFELSLEIKAISASGSSTYFASGSEKSTLGFPRYRVFFYNTTDRPVGVYLHAYLTH